MSNLLLPLPRPLPLIEIYFSFGKYATAKTKKELPSPSLTKVSFQALPVIRRSESGRETWSYSPSPDPSP